MDKVDAGTAPVPPPRVKKLARLAERKDRERRSVTWGPETWVGVRALRASSGGILDPDDRVCDVADDRETLTAECTSQTPQPRAAQADGASGSSAGTASPDMFRGGGSVGGSIRVGTTESCVEVGAGELEDGASGLQVRRGSEPTLQDTMPQQRQVSDQTKRWSAAVVCRDDSSRVTQKVHPLPDAGQERYAHGQHFQRQSNRLSMQFSGPGSGVWLDAAERVQIYGSKSLPRDARREPLGQDTPEDTHQSHRVEDMLRWVSGVNNVTSVPSVQERPLDLLDEVGSSERAISGLEVPVSPSSKPASGATQTVAVTLVKGEKGLGFTITTRDNPTGGHCPIYIKNILPKGAAVTDGRLRAGDRLVSVNNVSVSGLTQQQVVTLLRNTPTDSTVDIVVERSVPNRTQRVEPQQSPNKYAEKAIGSTNNVNTKSVDVNNQPENGRVSSMVNAINYNQSNNGSTRGRIPKSSSKDDLLNKDQDLDSPVQKALNSSSNSIPGLRNRLILQLDVPVHDSEKAGLGISVKGKVTVGSDPQDLGIFIKSVLHGGAASRDGRLHTNDQLVSVNGVSLVGQSNAQAMDTLRRALLHARPARSGRISLTVARRTGTYRRILRTHRTHAPHRTARTVGGAEQRAGHGHAAACAATRAALPQRPHLAHRRAPYRYVPSHTAYTPYTRTAPHRTYRRWGRATRRPWTRCGVRCYTHGPTATAASRSPSRAVSVRTVAYCVHTGPTHRTAPHVPPVGQSNAQAMDTLRRALLHARPYRNGRISLTVARRIGTYRRILRTHRTHAPHRTARTAGGAEQRAGHGHAAACAATRTALPQRPHLAHRRAPYRYVPSHTAYTPYTRTAPHVPPVGQSNAQAMDTLRRALLHARPYRNGRISLTVARRIGTYRRILRTHRTHVPHRTARTAGGAEQRAGHGHATACAATRTALPQRPHLAHRRAPYRYVPSHTAYTPYTRTAPHRTYRRWGRATRRPWTRCGVRCYTRGPTATAASRSPSRAVSVRTVAYCVHTVHTHRTAPHVPPVGQSNAQAMDTLRRALLHARPYRNGRISLTVARRIDSMDSLARWKDDTPPNGNDTTNSNDNSNSQNFNTIIYNAADKENKPDYTQKFEVNQKEVGIESSTEELNVGHVHMARSPPAHHNVIIEEDYGTTRGGESGSECGAAGAGFSRDAVGRRSMSEKRHAALDAKQTGTYKKIKETKAVSAMQVGPSLGMRKSSSLESLQTAIQETQKNPRSEPLYARAHPPLKHWLTDDNNAPEHIIRGSPQQSSLSHKKPSLLKSLSTMFRIGKPHKKNENEGYGRSQPGRSSEKSLSREALERHNRIDERIEDSIPPPPQREESSRSRQSSSERGSRSDKRAHAPPYRAPPARTAPAHHAHAVDSAWGPSGLYVNYEEIQNFNARREKLSEVQIGQMRLQMNAQRAKAEEESRRGVPGGYHSQRSCREGGQRPQSNYYEYESAPPRRPGKLSHYH
ncbi:unnamed protein product [Parnassius apollo]|uniref:(apollo) hypothetical protein n=1 Tax=Parnassius apollo TaxID=110799 RepID=A0A8S3WZA9_PARAO|nr:unnamed protein product [Parnassius apollo]